MNLSVMISDYTAITVAADRLHVAICMKPITTMNMPALDPLFCLLYQLGVSSV